MEGKTKELRKMSRTQLIEIIYALQQNERELQQQLDEANAQLADRRIVVDQAGSIAEAALGLNKVFEAAQAAADQYLDSLKAAAGSEADAVAAPAAAGSDEGGRN